MYLYKRENVKYFHTGCPPDNRMPLYGLYSVVHDCFLILYFDLDTVCRIKALWSSRYNLYIVQVNCADNFEPNLVDNSVCTNWGFSNSYDIDVFNYFSDKNWKPVLAKTLVGKKGTKQVDEKDLDLLHNMLGWLNLLAEIRHVEYQYTFADQMLNYYLELPDIFESQKRFMNIEKQIGKVLYIENNLDTANNKIQDIIKSNQWFYTTYKMVMP
jgi:hypothetical protein